MQPPPPGILDVLLAIALAVGCALSVPVYVWLLLTPVIRLVKMIANLTQALSQLRLDPAPATSAAQGTAEDAPWHMPRDGQGARDGGSGLSRADGGA